MLYHGDCVSILPTLVDDSIQAVITSPPYADQRKEFYTGISEKEYPAWTVKWAAALRPKLKINGGLIINICPHVKDGQVSDYVLRTRLALREDGWFEHLELIWLKPDAPPIARVDWCRRSWESILWFSQSKNPFINNKSYGKVSKRCGAYENNNRFGLYHDGIKKGKTGIARDTDIVIVPCALNSRGIMHPATYPIPLAEDLIQRFSNEGDLICDPFVGSGSTGIAARKLGREFAGIEINKEYFDLATARINEQV